MSKSGQKEPTRLIFNHSKRRMNTDCQPSEFDDYVNAKKISKCLTFFPFIPRSSMLFPLLPVKFPRLGLPLSEVSTPFLSKGWRITKIKNDTFTGISPTILNTLCPLISER